MLPSKRIGEIAKEIRASNSKYDGTSPSSIPSSTEYLFAIMEYLDEEYENTQIIRDLSDGIGK